MNITQFIVDAFTDSVFKGNPAAICLLDEWIPDDLMASIARENNLSETAFIVKEAEGYRLRWFTPEMEIDLCGHATLASAYVVMSILHPEYVHIRFQTLSGTLEVHKDKDGLLLMDFPSYSLKQIDASEPIIEAIGVCPAEAWLGRDMVCVLQSEEQVRRITPNLAKIKQLDGLLFHVTAQGSTYDCVSRTFAPKCGVEEDAVCGSGHCHIVPYWSKRLGKEHIIACQASKRGGILNCKQEFNRTIIGGKCAIFSKSKLYI